MKSVRAVAVAGLVGLVGGCCQPPVKEAEEKAPEELLAPASLESSVTVPNELIVKLVPGVQPEAILETLGQPVPEWRWLGTQDSHLLLLEWPETVDIEAVMETLRQSPDVSGVEPNYRMQIQAPQP